MRKALPYLVIEIIISLAASYAGNGGFDYDYLTVFGLVNLILGVLGLIVGAILSIAKEPNISKGLLISSALLLLMGFLTCSVFPMR
jgi:hypothetical protein